MEASMGDEYPFAAGHRGVDTSVAAADLINESLPRLQRSVLGVVLAAGDHGATGDEIASVLGWLGTAPGSASHLGTEVGRQNHRQRLASGRSVRRLDDRLDEPCLRETGAEGMSARPEPLAQFVDLSRHRLPWGYEVEFTLSAGHLRCEWSPDVPTGRRARKLLPFYRAARDAFLASVSPGNVLVVEL
jgi:hypothetical protein